MADLNETLLERGRDFPVQNLQDGLDIFPRCVSAQVAGEEAEEVCDTHTHTHTRTKTPKRKLLQVVPENAEDLT